MKLMEKLPTASAASRTRILAVDYGQKRIGLAISDELLLTARPLATLVRKNRRDDLRRLREIARAEGVVKIIVGHPLNMDGSDSPRTQSVRAFARNLAPLALPVLLWDERWSTAAVERAMIAADVSRAKRKERVDSAAAAFILQGAIDALVR